MKISDIYRYPVKGCSPEWVSRVDIYDRGLVGDRKFWLVDDKGTVISQRMKWCGKMARVRVRTQERGIKLEILGVMRHDYITTTYVEGMIEKRYSIFDKPVDALRSKKPLEGISEFLARDCFVAQNAPGARRANGNLDVYLNAQDTAPILIIGTATLDAINSRLEGDDLAMTAFRPNLVVQTTEPFAELTWSRIQVGDVSLRFAAPCKRCNVPTINPLTGKPCITQRVLREAIQGCVEEQSSLGKCLDAGYVVGGLYTLDQQDTGGVCCDDCLEVATYR